MTEIWIWIRVKLRTLQMVRHILKTVSGQRHDEARLEPRNSAKHDQLRAEGDSLEDAERELQDAEYRGVRRKK